MMVLKHGMAAALFCLCTAAYAGTDRVNSDIKDVSNSSNYVGLPDDVRRKADDIFESLNLNCIGLER